MRRQEDARHKQLRRSQGARNGAPAVGAGGRAGLGDRRRPASLPRPRSQRPARMVDPVLVDNQGPFALTTEVRGVSCPMAAPVSASGPMERSSHRSIALTPTATWKVAGVDAVNSDPGVSCLSSPALCVAVDDVGNAIVSTDPTGGPSNWTAFQIDSVFNSASMRNDSVAAASCVRRPRPVRRRRRQRQRSHLDQPDGRSRRLEAEHGGHRGPGQPAHGRLMPELGLCVAADAAGNVLAPPTRAPALRRGRPSTSTANNSFKSSRAPRRCCAWRSTAAATR